MSAVGVGEDGWLAFSGLALAAESKERKVALVVVVFRVTVSFCCRRQRPRHGGCLTAAAAIAAAAPATYMQECWPQVVLATNIPGEGLVGFGEIC